MMPAIMLGISSTHSLWRQDAKQAGAHEQRDRESPLLCHAGNAMHCHHTLAARTSMSEWPRIPVRWWSFWNQAKPPPVRERPTHAHKRTHTYAGVASCFYSRAGPSLALSMPGSTPGVFTTLACTSASTWPSRRLTVDGVTLAVASAGAAAQTHSEPQRVTALS